MDGIANRSAEQASGDGGGLLLVANFGENSVSVVDTASMTVVATIPAAGSPRGVAAVGANATYPNRAIVANAAIVDPKTGSQKGVVQVIDLSTLRVVSQVEIVLTSQPTETTYLYDAAITPDGHFGFVLLTEQSGEQSDGADNGREGRYDAHSSVHVIDLSDLNAPKDLGSTGDLGQGTIRIAMSPDGLVLLVANTNEGQVQPITWGSGGSPIKGTAFPSQALNSYPSSLAFLAPDLLLVGLYGADPPNPNLVTFTRTGTSWLEGGSPCTTLPNYPVALAPVSANSFLVALNTLPKDATGFVQLWTGGQPGTAIPVGAPSALAVSSDGALAFVADQSGNQVVPMAVSGAGLTAGPPIAVGAGPIALAMVGPGAAGARRVAAAPAPATTPAEPAPYGPGTPLGIFPYTFGGTCASSPAGPFTERGDPITVVWWGPGVLQFAHNPTWPAYPSGWDTPDTSGSAEDYILSLGAKGNVPVGIMQPLFDYCCLSTIVPIIGETGSTDHVISAEGPKCIDQVGQAAYPQPNSQGYLGVKGVPFNRCHIRIWPAMVDANGQPTTDQYGNYYFVGSPHNETWWLRADVFTCCGSTNLGNHSVNAGIPPGQGGYVQGRTFVETVFAKAGYPIAHTFAGNTMLEKQCTREFTGSDGVITWIYVGNPGTGPQPESRPVRPP